MNERIKELIPRPWTFPYPDREMYSREQMEHLAESIVRECANYITHKATIETLRGERLKENFGVEE